MKDRRTDAPRRGPTALEQRINAAVESLHRKLVAGQQSGLSISDYSAKYLGESLGQGTNGLRIFGRVLRIALADGPESLPDARIIDFGGGNGLLSLLAREVGVGTVVFNDIYDVSCTDAERIGAALGLEADQYVQGDVRELISAVRATPMPYTAVCSYDVIEHVYDVDATLADLPRFADGSLTVVMASSANGLNPRRRSKLKRFQLEIEDTDRAGVNGHSQRDALPSYRALRAAMIRDHAPFLRNDQVDDLARVTRGLAGKDIETAVDQYVSTGVLPNELAHPTNTCDPSTGNWAEHLMDPRALAQKLGTFGLRSHVEAGYYGRYPGLKGIAARILNVAIRLGGRQGLRLAPYYILVGMRPKVPSVVVPS